jgi:hypothetical protein
MLFAKAAKNIRGICQSVANNLGHSKTNLQQRCQHPLTPCNKFVRGLATTYGIFAIGLEGCPITHKGATFVQYL